MKEKIDVFAYTGEIMKAMKTGILLTTKAGDQVNTMTIGWGVLGIEWAAPIFTVFVRESRFTRDCLECRVVYKQLQDKDAIPQEIQEKFYPQDVDGSFPMCNRDFHIAYYGEIVAAYIIKPDEQ